MSPLLVIVHEGKRVGFERDLSSWLRHANRYEVGALAIRIRDGILLAIRVSASFVPSVMWDSLLQGRSRSGASLAYGAGTVYLAGKRVA